MSASPGPSIELTEMPLRELHERDFGQESLSWKSGKIILVTYSSTSKFVKWTSPKETKGDMVFPKRTGGKKRGDFEELLRINKKYRSCDFKKRQQINSKLKVRTDTLSDQ